MIKNIEAMEWQNNDTLRTMVSKYNSNMRKLCTEYNQTAKATEDGTMISPNCSYARVCDWKDGNKLEEERYGYFVTLTESSDVVTIADDSSDVLGVTTENPAFSSNADDDKFKLGKLSATHCYVSILGNVKVRQDGSITEGVKFCCNSNGVAKATDSIGYKVTKIIDENYVLIDLKPSTELIGKVYEELSQKIDNKKAGLIEVSYETWLSLTQEERVILGDVIIPDHPIEYTIADAKNDIDAIKEDGSGLKEISYATWSEMSNAQKEALSDVIVPDHPNTADVTQSILLSSETNEFIYESSITTISKTTLLHNVFNVDENLVLYKSNDHSKFNLSTITYKSAVDVDLRVEDTNNWRWYCILPTASEKTTFDLTTATWKLSGYQPNHADDEEKPAEPTIEKVDYATFLLENSSDASNEAIFDLYELEGVTKIIIKRELSAKVLDGLVKSVNGVTADENGNVIIKSGGLEVGDIALAPLGIDETDNCRRYLNGQVILQSQFSKFTEKLKHAITLYPNLVTSEDNWQSAVALSPLGQCGKFVIDDEAGTIRLPKVVNVMGALDLSTIGQTVEAGLPNIKGGVGNFYLNNTIREGAFKATQALPNGSTWLSGGDGMRYQAMYFDASFSNPIYGNSETVQQESIKYPYFIQVATSNTENVQIDTQVRLNNPFSLFMPYWSPIELNNLSWLRSNKQWNNGSVYTSAYEFLLEKYNSGTEQTETIKGVSVTYKLADNGMKIITDKSVYDALISASGSAWFFVLDTENTQFVLPYTNGFAQFGNELGKFTEAGLPNITGKVGRVWATSPSGISQEGALYTDQMIADTLSGGGGNNCVFYIQFDASRVSATYGKSDTVQPNSVTGYLYFYIGEVEQDANIIATSGLAESVSRKADVDLGNVPSSKGILVESYHNGSSWYRVYSDGWCEQGSVYPTRMSNDANVIITLLVPYIDTNYSAFVTSRYTGTSTGANGSKLNTYVETSTQFRIINEDNPAGSDAGAFWYACGYIS